MNQRGCHMGSKEAKARIKIIKLLEAAGWRFFDNDEGSANIQVEANVKITKRQYDGFGKDLEKVKNGFIDFYCLTNTENRLSCLKQSQKTRILWSEKIRLGNMPRVYARPECGEEQLVYDADTHRYHCFECDENFNDEDLAFCERCGSIMWRNDDVLICQNCIEDMAHE